MKNTIMTVLFCLVSTGCAFYAMVYPAWFQQHYTRNGNDVFQGYGIFAFYSTGTLKGDFYASETTLQYSDFCDSDKTPNYMLSDGDEFRAVLCGKAMTSIQGTTATGASLSIVALISSIIAVYNPSAGIAEKIVSSCTLISSLLLAISLVIWGWMIQQRLYGVDSINSAYNICKSDRTNWSCWFYGYSFWSCLAAVILMSIAGYLSSAGRAEKIRYFRKEFERDLAVAVAQSLEQDEQRQRGYSSVENNVTTGYVRSSTPGNILQQPSYQPYGGGKEQQQHQRRTSMSNNLPPFDFDDADQYTTPMISQRKTHNGNNNPKAYRGAYLAEENTMSTTSSAGSRLQKIPNGGVI